MGRSQPSGSRTGLANARREAIRAIAKCHGAGIAQRYHRRRPHRAGDRQVGLESSAEVVALSGRELETAERASVFARVALEQKLRLALALQAGGNVVAMIGDGVNHASALKQVEMGVAMDITGTDVTKEAADMALTDDNFASIEAAVEEGRAVFDNLTKFIVWILPINAGSRSFCSRRSSRALRCRYCRRDCSGSTWSPLCCSDSRWCSRRRKATSCSVGRAINKNLC